MKLLMLILMLLGTQECEGGLSRPTQQELEGMTKEELLEKYKTLDSAFDGLYKTNQELSESIQLTMTHCELLSTELASVKQDLNNVYRPHARNVLCRLMLQRFLAPVDMWFENPNIAKEIIPGAFTSTDPERWYALYIHPEDRAKSSPIWIKFSLNYIKERAGNEWYVRLYTDRKRAGLLETLERYFTMLLDDPEYLPTMISGTPHVYRLPSMDSDPEKRKKEDLIY